MTITVDNRITELKKELYGNNDLKSFQGGLNSRPHAY